VLAAGGALWRPAGTGIEVAVVHRPRYDDWSLPKGKLTKGEDAVVGALREVREETGVRAVAGAHLGTSTYAVVLDGVMTPKTVEWWAMRALSGAFEPNDEVDQVRWCTPDLAADLLTAGRDVEQVRLLAGSALGASTAVLVRHAAAGSRAKWDGPDEDRPLSDRGRAQAAELVAQLSSYGVTRVVSAPPLRCVATVTPLADALGLPVEVEPLLGDDRWSDRASVERWWSLVGDGVPVVCSQGGAIPALLGALPGFAEWQPHTRKGAAWVLTSRDRQVVAVEHRPPPA
jgi:8-oxo-dGTP diphosphatase